MEYKVSFAHGKKENAKAAIENGKINEDDFIIFSDTDDEIAFVNHNKEVKPIKSRTNDDINLEENFVIPKGTSIDDFIKLLSSWIKENKEKNDAAVNEKLQEVVDQIVDFAPEDLDTLKEVADWIEEHGEDYQDVASKVEDFDKVNDLPVDEETGETITITKFVEKAVEIIEF